MAAARLPAQPQGVTLASSYVVHSVTKHNQGFAIRNTMWLLNEPYQKHSWELNYRAIEVREE